ncbi:ATP-binding protein [Amycolatopsis cihanbeyliensis]|uniref:Anti-sigma regulatory factor (Ser/Thr protein kinase) n=1 Tax=Amycolatopsis cihanbeyliensis TaxID=1128664 RepID=A0A542CUA9_AMYCI|nr:ATP-binding protein [Amycolatopsis cihanbeyliensis]TQI94401.1 anti-sigma regulatory factor (Ser/Thr protein kinase) [Amycolatopsis cihanbeyliensis]
MSRETAGGQQPLTIDFAVDRRSASVARRVAAATLRGHRVPDELTSDIVQVVSELVTNAIKHGAAPASLEVECVTAQIVVRVRDGGAGLPVLREQSVPPVEGGHGLRLVHALATRWGYSRERRGVPGKQVWAEFRR